MSTDAAALALLRAKAEALGGLRTACERSDAFAAALNEVWEQGWAWELVCDEKQAGWIRRYEAGEGSYFWAHGRQRGKTFGALAMHDRYGRLWAESRQRYCALTIDTARALLGAAMADFYATCHEDLRPKARGDDYFWPNGSHLIVMGTDAQTFRRGRGFSRIARDTRDECGFYQDFDAIDRALNPGLQVPGPSGEPGRVLYMTTPSESPGHASSLTRRVHQARGAFELETFYDNPRVNPEAIIREQMLSKGLTREQVLASTAFRREFKSEDVVEETRAAIPRWTPEAAKALTIEVPLPEFYDGYSSTDVGYSPDPSAGLLGWHDVERNAIVITHEYEVRAGTVAELAKRHKELEAEAWGVERYDGTLLALADEVAELPEFLQRKVHKNAPRQPYLRVGDDNLIVLAELADTHKLGILPTKKSEKALHVDFLNQLITARRFYVHPRCVRLLEQLTTTVWNKARTEWERTARDHGELVDCAVYIARNVRWHRDCRPPKPVTVFHSSPVPKSARSGWEDAFKRRRR